MSTNSSKRLSSKKTKEKTQKIINEPKAIKDLEKNYLKGEKHKEITDSLIQIKEEEPKITEEKKEKSSSIDSQSNTLLKEKLFNIDINIKTLNGINKSMEKQIKDIEKDILENHILITEPRKIFNKNEKNVIKAIKNINFDEKNKLKAIKDLHEKKKNLNTKLQKIMENEKYIQNEANIDKINLSDKNISLVDLNILENKKKNLNEKKNDILQKIDAIEDNIKTLALNSIQNNKQIRLKNYLENFEKDKEKIELRAKQYYKESEERKKRIELSLNKKYEKIRKYQEEKEFKENNKFLENLKKMKEKEKLIQEKRTKENDEKYNKYKPFLANKIKNKLKDYLFIKKEDNYLNEEKKLVEKENLRRKEKMKINFNDINEFSNKLNTYKEKNTKEQNERKKQLLLEWKERKNALPLYTLNLNNLNKNIDNENNNNKNEEGINTLRENHDKMILFANEIKNKKKPNINPKLKNEREFLIRSLENPKLSVKLSQKILYSKFQKFTENNIFKLKSKNKNKLTEVKLNKSLSPKTTNIKIKLFPLHPKPKNKIDYLTEMIVEKEKVNKNKNNLIINDDDDSIEEFKDEKWIKEIKDKNGSVIENINYVKEKAKFMDDKVKQKSQIIKLNGGVENNPEISQQVSELLLDSISAKLSILNLYKN